MVDHAVFGTQTVTRRRKVRRKRKSLFLPLYTACIAAGCLLLLFYSLRSAGSEIENPAAGGSFSLRLIDSSASSADSSETVYEEWEAQISEMLPEVPKVSEVLQRLREYPVEILELLVRNPETIDFVLGYPDRFDLPLDSESQASVIAADGSVPLFLQWDRRWGYNAYGNSCIALAGCGPACLSMVAVALTGNPALSPDTVAKFSEENGYADPSAGTKWSLMTAGAEELGLVSAEIPLDYQVMANRLAGGSPLIISLRAGDFTTEGHFIVLKGLAQSGAFLVNDPNSVIRSEMEWDYDTLMPQIRNIWAFSME